MKGNAEYYLIRALPDYKLVRQFIRENGGGEDDAPLSFPTVVAIDQSGDILGCLSTALQKDLIVSGPLVIKKDINGYRVVVGLVDAYDKVMQSLGVTSYIHSVAEENTKWLAMIEKAYGDKPYAHEQGRYFFVKHLDKPLKAEATIH